MRRAIEETFHAIPLKQYRDSKEKFPAEVCVMMERVGFSNKLYLNYCINDLFYNYYSNVSLLLDINHDIVVQILVHKSCYLLYERNSRQYYCTKTFGTPGIRAY